MNKQTRQALAAVLALGGFAVNLWAASQAANGTMNLPTVVYQIAGIAALLLALYVNSVSPSE